MKSLSVRGYQFYEIYPSIWRLDPFGPMQVGVHCVSTAALMKPLSEDKSLEQAIAVACLPGVVDPVLTMPDLHQGYGFPIGGVAAFREKNGVVSPGGVGYDINCGVRLLRTPLERKALGEKKHLVALVNDLFKAVPAGIGSKRRDLSISNQSLKSLTVEGAEWAVKEGYGTKADLEFIEERGKIRNADPDKVSKRAFERGANQLGTLGSGNHFLEVQIVDEIFDKATAEGFGLFQDQVVITIHTGSRGLGYQVCTDYLEASFAAGKKYKIPMPNRELASVPLTSVEGQSYLSAMACAANFAFANRQIITHWVREIFSKRFEVRDVSVVYDICHNIAKFEELQIGSHSQRVCVHRKGATRAYPPHHPTLPKAYQSTGQPVIVPGDMGRYSFVMAGLPDSLSRTFGSACHGAGRHLSRAQAKKVGKGRALLSELEAQGIFVKTAGRETALEEMPEAYKDVSEVVSATEQAGVAKIVARLRPVGVVKG